MHTLPRSLCLLAAIPAMLAAEPTVDHPWTDDIIYFVLTDRFLDADPANNIPPGSPVDLHDPARKDINRYHGGDLRGLERAIQSGYFTRLGVTALWITPPVRNVWLNKYDFGGPKTGYHGYWAQDFLDIDPHLTSRTSLDGKTNYPDTRDGRMAHYRDFIALARTHGIKIIQDVVCNHTGPAFYYDSNGDGNFDTAAEAEWIQPYQSTPRPNARWGNEPAWNLLAVQPAGPATVLGHSLSLTGAVGKLESFSRRGFNHDSLGKNTDEGIWCDFTSLRDYDTSPGSPHFNAMVEDFAEIYRFYIQDLGVSGLRIDTVKHVHHEFWDAFTRKLREKLGPEGAKKLILFGEVYDGDPAVLGRYTYRADWPADGSPSLDSVLDFQFCFGVRSFLRQAGGLPGDPRAVENALNARLHGTDGKRPNYNQVPGPDGHNAIAKAISFVENHDGLNRFRVKGISENQHLLAQAVMFTSPGIPCLYYGAEAALADELGETGKDGETGRFTMFSPQGKPTRMDVEQSRAFKAIAGLTALRQRLPAMRLGTWQPLWVDSPETTDDDGTLIYLRQIPGNPESTVLIALNASEKSARIKAVGLDEKVKSLAAVTLPGFASPAAPVLSRPGTWELPGLPPGTVSIFTATPNP